MTPRQYEQINKQIKLIHSIIAQVNTVANIGRVTTHGIPQIEEICELTGEAEMQCETLAAKFADLYVHG